MGWILWPSGIGWKARSRTVRTGTFACRNPNCKGRRSSERQHYRLRQHRNWVVVFYLPVLPLNKLGVSVQCASCKTPYSLDVVTEEELAATQTTSGRSPTRSEHSGKTDRACPVCGFPVTAATDYRCSSCGDGWAATIGRAVNLFEEDEERDALDLLSAELDRARDEDNEVALAYLIDVAQQMIPNVRTDWIDEFREVLANAQDSLHSLQKSTLPEKLVEARELFDQGDIATALELLHLELAAASTCGDDGTSLWRVFSVAREMAVSAEPSETRPFQHIAALAERRLTDSNVDGVAEDGPV
jgi:hypothetical protein